MHSSYRSTLFLILILFKLLIFNTLNAQEVSDGNCADKVTTFSIGTGAEDGGYYNFSKLMDSYLESECIKLSIKPSKGSNKNISDLNKNKIDLAIIQSDVSYKSIITKNPNGEETRQKQNFETLLPLFKEYIQLVYLQKNKADTLWLGDLKDKTVLIGEKGSGTAVNADDLIKDAGLNGKINKINGDLCTELRKGTAIAGFTTSKNLQHCNDERIRHIAIPKALLKKIAKKNRYYNITEQKIRGEDIPLLAVTAYLVIRKNIDKEKKEKAKILIDTMTEHWDLLDKQITPLSRALNKSIIPETSNISEQVIVSKGYAINPSREYSYLIIWIILSFIIYFLNKDKDAYNRLGHHNHSHSIRTKVRFWFIKFGNTIQTISILLIILSIFTIIIQQSEQSINPYGEFSNMSMWELIIWAFTFMASGFTSDLYPSSSVGQSVVAILASVGLIGPLIIIFKLIDQVKERDKIRRRGGAKIKKDNHVIICGWNEKVPGILYSLTCNDAPVKQHVIVIAEIDEQYPLDAYDFNRKYVEYYRDDSTCIEALNNISASNATTAIIVAGDKKKKNKNINSVLTALALRNINKDIFIVAELAFSENRDYFKSADIDKIIDFKIISNYLITLSSISPSIIDFLLDILTYDNYSEIYSVKTDVIKNYKPEGLRYKIKELFNTSHKEYRNQLIENLKSSPSAEEITNELLTNGVNFIGYSNPNSKGKGVINANFNLDKHTFPIIESEKIHSDCNSKEGSIIYLADDQADIFFSNKESSHKHTEQLNKKSITLPKPKKINILLLDRNSHRFDDIKKSYDSLPFDISIHTNSKYLIEETLKTRPIIEDIKSNHFTHIIILSNKNTNKKILTEDRGEVDAKSILISSTIRNDKSLDGVKIIAELTNIKNKHLFISAGIDVIIPKTLFTERMLTKLVYNHGVVTDFFTALLNVEDSRFLHVVNVDDNSPFLSYNYPELWITHFYGGKLIACLPKDQIDTLKNTEGDFSTHYITSPKALQNIKVKSGDELVFIINSSKVKWK